MNQWKAVQHKASVSGDYCNGSIAYGEDFSMTTPSQAHGNTAESRNEVIRALIHTTFLRFLSRRLPDNQQKDHPDWLRCRAPSGGEGGAAVAHFFLLARFASATKPSQLDSNRGIAG
jgi:hypothetical protein